MQKEQLAQRYLANIKGCFTAVKILISLFALFALGLFGFFCVASATGFRQTNMRATALTAAILGIAMAAAALGLGVAIIVAKINLKKLEKLGPAEE